MHIYIIKCIWVTVLINIYEVISVLHTLQFKAQLCTFHINILNVKRIIQSCF